ncbi:glycoside hydrolase superfamily [Syncephalis fuscata]|nr:glycoside hydrolase superfamily [Syncephalis fuscata]
MPTSNKLVLYWGQNSFGATHGNDKTQWENRLTHYCESGLLDTVVLSFMHVFGLSPDTQMDYANHCPPTQLIAGTKLLDCPELRGDIQRCQSLGVKVQLGLGGAASAFSGNGKIRPFGDVVLDGVNLDIEGGNPYNYAAFVDQLRQLHSKTGQATHTSKHNTNMAVSANHRTRPLIITAAPQCPYPDAYMHDVLTKSEIDAVYVQFYNNYCGTQAFGTSNFNFDVGMNGVPASPTAANIGYVAPDKLQEIITSVQTRYPSFGGVMMWDTSQAFANQDDGSRSYAIVQSKHSMLPVANLDSNGNSSSSSNTEATETAEATAALVPDTSNASAETLLSTLQ